MATKIESDHYYMQLAIREALAGKAKGEPPFGGVMVDGHGRIITKAHDTVRQDGDMTSHSEMLLVREACRKLGPDLSGCIVYATCEPCPLCFAALWLAKVPRVVFGSYIHDVLRITGGKQRELPIRASWLNRKSGYCLELKGGVLRGECSNLFLNS